MKTAEPPQESETIEGLSNIAAAIASHFKIPCAKQNIVHWRKYDPPFPPAKNNRFHRESCFQWVEKNILPKYKNGDGQNLAELFEKAQRAKAIEQIKKAEKLTKLVDILDEKYILKTSSKATLISTLKIYHNFVKAELERGLPIERREKLAALGASPEIVAAFFEYDLQLANATIDKIEDHCAEASL